MEPVVGVGKVEILDESECRALLARQPVGRIAYVTDTGKPLATRELTPSIHRGAVAATATKAVAMRVTTGRARRGVQP